MEQLYGTYDAQGDPTSALTSFYFEGGSYEVDTNGSTTTKVYYAFAGQTVAMRNGPPGTPLEYFLTDQLGSVILVLDASGNPIAGTQQRYMPFGQSRFNNTPVTDFAYTGQRDLDMQGNLSLGLMDYNARFYDDYINRWTQPDTLTPGGPQGLNRYSYVDNSPLDAIDPSGNTSCSDIPNEQAQAYCESQGGEFGFGIDTALDVMNKYWVNPYAAPTWDELPQGERNLLVAAGCAACDKVGWNAEVRGSSTNIDGTLQDPAVYLSLIASGGMTGLWSSGFGLLQMGISRAGSLVMMQFVSLLATWFTINPDSTNVSLGSYAYGSGYTLMGNAINMTYLQAPSFAYEILNKLDLWDPVNQAFINDQAEQLKTFFITQIGDNLGPDTLNEMDWIRESGAYDEMSSLWSSFVTIFTPKQ